MNRHARPHRWPVAIALLLFDLACAQRLAPPEPAVEEVNVLSDELALEGLDLLRSYADRLSAVSDPLRLAAANECDDHLVTYLGIITEAAPGESTPLMRAQRLRGVGLRWTIVTVMGNSPAAQAELKVGDIIHSINDDQPWPFRIKSDSPEETQVEIERAGERMQVVLPFSRACTPAPKFSPRGFLSTFRHQYGIAVNRGLMDFVLSDDQLAIVIAHQLAHYLLDNEYARITLEVEVRADRFALDLALRAGYDISGGVEVWEQLAIQQPWMIGIDPEYVRRVGNVSHGYVAARTLLMPQIIADLLVDHAPK